MDAELHIKLGGLGEAVKNLDENLRAMREAQTRMEERAEKRAEVADGSRRLLYKKVDVVSDRVAALDKKVDVELNAVREQIGLVDAKASDAKAAGDDYRRVVQQGKGALLVFGFGGTAFGAGVYYFFESVLKWFRLKLGL